MWSSRATPVTAPRGRGRRGLAAFAEASLPQTASPGTELPAPSTGALHSSRGGGGVTPSVLKRKKVHEEEFVGRTATRQGRTRDAVEKAAAQQSGGGVSKKLRMSSAEVAGRGVGESLLSTIRASVSGGSPAAEARRCFSAVLDEELEAFCRPVLDKARHQSSAPLQGGGGVTSELLSQLKGLAEVRHFVDEQLAADLGARVRSCRDLARRVTSSFSARPKAATAQLSLAASTAGRGQVRTPLPQRQAAAPGFEALLRRSPSPAVLRRGQTPGKLALAPFRSSSQGMTR